MEAMGNTQPQPSLRPAETASRFAVIAALLLGNFALAFGPWLVRMADVGPSASAMWRMALAAPVLFAITATRRQPLLLPGRGLYLTMIFSGLFFAVDLAAWHIGILMTKMGNATLFANAASLFFPVWGYLVARSLPSRREGLAFALAALGAILLVGRSAELSREHLVGDMLCLAAGLCYTGYLVLIAGAREKLPSWTLLSWSTVATILPLLAIAVLLGERIMPVNWTPVIALAVVSQLFGQGMMVYALGRVSPLIFGLALLTQPIVSASMGWISYGETLAPLDVVGAVMIGLALILVRQPDRSKDQLPPSAEIMQ
jgi:drug/metabolite transporter (DMT)-like permease